MIVDRMRASLSRADDVRFVRSDASINDPVDLALAGVLTSDAVCEGPNIAAAESRADCFVLQPIRRRERASGDAG